MARFGSSFTGHDVCTIGLTGGVFADDVWAFAGGGLQRGVRTGYSLLRCVDGGSLPLHLLTLWNAPHLRIILLRRILPKF